MLKKEWENIEEERKEFSDGVKEMTSLDETILLKNMEKEHGKRIEKFDKMLEQTSQSNLQNISNNTEQFFEKLNQNTGEKAIKEQEENIKLFIKLKILPNIKEKVNVCTEDENDH
jgi:hypothetical protein